MNKKTGIRFVGFMIVLFSFFHLFFEFGYQVPGRYELYIVIRFVFLSTLLPPIFLIIIAILEKKRRKTVLKTSKNSNILLNLLINSFFLLINSLLIFNTIVVSIYDFAKVLFFVLPLFAVFNILWIITKLNSFQDKEKYTTISDKIIIKKKIPTNAILIIIDVLLFIANFLSVFNDFNSQFLGIFIPTLILFNIFWIIFISKWRKGRESDRMILKITLSLFGFNLFWNIIGIRFRPFFITNIPLTISGIIYTVLQLRKIKKINSVDSDNFEANNEDLIDEHLDLMRKLNGNK